MIPDSVTLLLLVGAIVGLCMYMGGSFDWWDD